MNVQTLLMRLLYVCKFKIHFPFIIMHMTLKLTFCKLPCQQNSITQMYMESEQKGNTQKKYTI